MHFIFSETLGFDWDGNRVPQKQDVSECPTNRRSLFKMEIIEFPSHFSTTNWNEQMSAACQEFVRGIWLARAFCLLMNLTVLIYG
jgi:hypothetical protein